MKYRAFRKLLARLLALCLLLSGLPALAEDDAIDVGDVSVEDDFAVAVDVQKNETEVNVPDKEPQSSEASDVTVNAGSVNLTLSHTPAEGTTLTVFDGMGREVMRQPLREQVTRIVTSGFAAGVYTLTVSGPQGTASRRLSVE